MIDARASPPPDAETAERALAPLYALIVFFLTLDTLFLLLRFFTVLFLRPKKLALGWDDLCLIPAWLCTIGVMIASCGATK